MILTDQFVLLHLHKSGGSFANAIVLRHFPEARDAGYHLPRSLIPDTHATLPVLGFVRSPWSYYVSWYSFQLKRPQPNLLFRVLSEAGTLDFAGTVRNMLELGTRGHLLDALVAGLPQHYGNRGLNLPGPALARIRGSGLGFYSFLHDYLYAPTTHGLDIGRLEALRAELPRMLESAGVPLTAALLADVGDQPARNTSDHADYTGYYDAALRQLVAERDAGVVTRYDYRFGA